MFIHNLSLLNFRNYINEKIEFSADMNIVSGANAQGKTNLLEAVYLLTGAKSFRTRFDGEMIRLGEDNAKVDATFFSEGRNQRLELTLRRGQRKSILLNGAKKTAGELSGTLTAVLFCPEDLALIKSGASSRRRLLDNAISQLRPGYASALTEFNRFYEHKTRILRDCREKPSLLDALDEFSDGLLRTSAQLIRYRSSFVERLAKNAPDIHAEFSGGSETLTLLYKTVAAVSNPLAGTGEIFKSLKEHHITHRQAEISSRQCLTGAHKDDILIIINDKEARTFASQGQARTAALSIKLAERLIHKSEKGEFPILLLDDVLSELDPQRRDFVLNKISGGQTLISCCEDGEISKKTGGRIIAINNGKIREVF